MSYVVLTHPKNIFKVGRLIDMDVIAVINYKGGVGKTTVTSNLAGELAFRGKKVLLIDTDAQASLTFSFVTPDQWDRDYKPSKTIKSWFDAISEGNEPLSLNNFVVSPTQINSYLINSRKSGRVDLICSHLGLINVDLELATLLGGANMQQTKKNYLKVHGKLREAIEDLSNNSDYDIVLIDCPPNFNIVTKNAIVASQKILIPAKPDYLSTLGIDYLSRSVNQLVKEFNEFAEIDTNLEKIYPQTMGVVFTMIQITSGQPISAQRQYISQTKRLGISTFEKYFRENKSIFANAPESLMPVSLQKYSNVTHSGIVEEIEAFVDEFESRL
jgi:chromosome partitioning protein